MNVGSLFTGIGGFDLGLERAGMRVVWQCESDDYCRRVLAKHWPHVPCFEDVRDLSSAAGTPRVDVLCGGFPCQDISLAGRGAGIEGARSGLWSEYARLIGELRPRYVIVENVSALLARGMGRVLGDLAALGYDAEWDCIPASAVGAPHQRDRVWLVAYPNGEGQPSAPLNAEAGRRFVVPELADAQGVAIGSGLRPDESGGQWRGRSGDGGRAGDVADPESNGCGSRRPGRFDPADSGERESERSLQDADERTLQSWRVGGRAAQAGGPEWWAAEPPVGRVAHGVPDRLDQLAALGNSLVPQIAEWIGRRIMSYEAT